MNSAITETVAVTPSTPTTQDSEIKTFRVLTLDGGGSKGFYTLGVLKEIEAMLDCSLYKYFDLVYGTSTGSIIASLIALGYSVDSIHNLYKEHVPEVMKRKSASDKSRALNQLACDVFKNATFKDVKTRLGIVATNWDTNLPFIFKSDHCQAHGRINTFVPGFGVSIADAVQASCSAYPIFNRKFVMTADGNKVELMDGGYCANNPTLYAIVDVTKLIGREHLGNMRLVNIGVGNYPEPKPKGLKMWFAKNYMISVQLWVKTLEINTQSMERLRQLLFKEIDDKIIRISDTINDPRMATDLMEFNLDKLNILRQWGMGSFAQQEAKIRTLLSDIPPPKKKFKI